MNDMREPIQSSGKFLTFLFLMIVMVIGNWAGVQETLVTIANESNFVYEGPEVKIGPDGAIYVVYRAKNESTGRSDIYLSKYENGQVTFLKNVSDSKTKSLEPDLDVLADGSIHVAWIEQTGTIHKTKYRYFDGENWSGIWNFGQETCDFVEDFRMDVDESGNTFVVYTYWPQARCRFISKYGDTVNFENNVVGGRVKHMDVVVDKDYIHVDWQHSLGGTYTIAYTKRKNEPGSKWEPMIDLGHRDTQRPRISLGSQGIPQVMLVLKEGSVRSIWHKKWNGSKFDQLKQVSPPDGSAVFHFYDMMATDPDNVIITAQKGSGTGGKEVDYNWRQNGQWRGLKAFTSTASRKPIHQSVDLKPDSLTAVLAFSQQFNSIHLVIAEEKGNGENKPNAAFSHSPHSGSLPLEVNFDASSSTDQGGKIVSYRWDFGDGTYGTGKTIKHTYTAEGNYRVKLRVYDNDSNSDITSGNVEVVAILPPLSVTYELITNRGFLYWEYLGKISWQDNPSNADNGINVVKYNIYRKLEGDTNYTLYDSVDLGAAHLYYDRLGTTKMDYVYTVSAVDDQDRESALPEPVYILHPENK